MSKINKNIEKNLFKKIVKNDPIWYEKPSVLFSINNITNFFPSELDSYSEKLNSIVRFSMYLSVILMIVKTNYLYIYIFLITCLITFLLHKNNVNIEKLSSSIEYNKCIEPTKNNPFMNVLMSDYKYNPKRRGCNIDDSVKERISKSFNYNLYQDVSDIYQNSNSQRQYYTMPSTTIPNDQSSFANWLYKTPTTCKSGDGTICSSLQPKNMNLPNQLYKY